MMELVNCKYCGVQKQEHLTEDGTKMSFNLHPQVMSYWALDVELNVPVQRNVTEMVPHYCRRADVNRHQLQLAKKATEETRKSAQYVSVKKRSRIIQNAQSLVPEVLNEIVNSYHCAKCNARSGHQCLNLTARKAGRQEFVKNPHRERLWSLSEKDYERLKSASVQASVAK